MAGDRFQRDAAEQAVAGGLTGLRGTVDNIVIFSDVEVADVTVFSRSTP